MWLDTPAGADLIEIDPTTVSAGARQMVDQVIRGADAMGIHFSGLGTPAPSACLCDLWDSSIPGVTEEVGALGDAVLKAFNDYCLAMNELAMRANQLQAEQAQATMTPGLGTQSVDPSFGALLAQAIVNDSMNSAAGVWLGSRPSTSQVEILLAMQQNQASAGLGAPLGTGFAGATAGSIIADSNDHAAKVWLAPEGTSYAGEDESGRDTYRGSDGDIGTMSEIRRDTHDENNNGDSDDYTV